MTTKSGRGQSSSPKHAPEAQRDAPAGPLAIVYRPLAELTPYAKNSRTHSEEQIDQIAASMNEFGWTNPILIDEAGTIIAGHGHLLAAQKLGVADVPTIEIKGLSDTQRRALLAKRCPQTVLRPAKESA